MLGLMEMIKRINDELDECEICGQLSHLKHGLCDWCQKVYEANK